MPLSFCHYVYLSFSHDIHLRLSFLSVQGMTLPGLLVGLFLSHLSQYTLDDILLTPHYLFEPSTTHISLLTYVATCLQ